MGVKAEDVVKVGEIVIKKIKEVWESRPNGLPITISKPVPAKCLDCGKHFQTTFGNCKCPKCNSGNVHIEYGK